MSKKCSLCGSEYKDYGHNPEPIKDFKERCCDNCNATKVIPARLGKIKFCHRCKKICDDSIPISIEDDKSQYYLCEVCDKSIRWEDE